MDKLQQMKIFVAVVDCNGFAGAARKLKISPPVVTRAINELESELDVRCLLVLREWCWSPSPVCAMWKTAGGF